MAKLDNLLTELKKNKNQTEYLYIIEEKYGKDTKIEVMLLFYTEQLKILSFNVEDYIKPYSHWNNYERMKLVRNKFQEMKNPVIYHLLQMIKRVNETYTTQQKLNVKNEMKEKYFASLRNSGKGLYFHVDEEYYEVLTNFYYDKITGIFI